MPASCNREVVPAPSFTPAPERPWRFVPLLFIGFAATCLAAGELLLKRGAMATIHQPPALRMFGVSVLASGWTWIGIVFYIAGFLGYLRALRQMPLHLAFSLMSIEYVIVPLGAKWFFAESIGVSRWCGIAIIITEIAVLAGSAMRTEKDL